MMGNWLIAIEQTLKRNTHGSTIMFIKIIMYYFKCIPSLILCGIVAHCKLQLEIKRIKQNQKPALSGFYICRQPQDFTPSQKSLQ